MHEHRFREIEGWTEMANEVEWEQPPQPLGEIARPLVRAQLECIFRYRQAAIRRLLLGETASG